jgi:hypothetical protein
MQQPAVNTTIRPNQRNCYSEILNGRPSKEHQHLFKSNQVKIDKMTSSTSFCYLKACEPLNVNLLLSLARDLTQTASSDFRRIVKNDNHKLTTKVERK